MTDIFRRRGVETGGYWGGGRPARDEPGRGTELREARKRIVAACRDALETLRLRTAPVAPLTDDLAVAESRR